MSEPILTIHSDGKLTIHKPVTLGDVLALLDAAKNGVLSTSIWTKPDEAPAVDKVELPE